MGVEQAAYEALVQDAVIATIPTTGDPSPRIPPEQTVDQGLLATWDPNYRERLDIS